MPPVVIDLQKADDQRDVIHRAVQALAEGNVVAVPTETVYGLAASALNPDAVQRLMEIKQRSSSSPMTLAVKSADDALDYVPSMSRIGRRLMRRCWPGPVTLVLDNQHADSLSRQLPSFVQKLVCPNGTLGLRVPAHQVVLSILRLSAGPLVLTSANPSGGDDAVTAEQVVEALGDLVPLVLDDGRCRYGQASAVIQVQDNVVRVLRPGLINEVALRRLCDWTAVIVCTGNTCRSPMAEVLFRKRLAERMGLPVGEIERHGAMVMSAGIAAVSGAHASPEAVAVLQSRGLDLSGHQSQPVTDRMIQSADLILTMTRSHRDAIISHWPDVAERCHLICRDGNDVSDPIGGPADLYARCADQIDAQIVEWVNSVNLEQEIVLLEPGGVGE